MYLNTFVVSLFLSFALSQRAESPNELKIKFLENYFQVEKNTQRLFAYVNWNKADISNLITFLNNKFIVHRIFNLDFKNIYNTSTLPKEPTVHILDLKSNDFNNVIEQALANKQFSLIHKWVIFDNSLNIIKDTSFKIPLNSNVFIIKANPNNTRMYMNSIHKIDQNSTEYIESPIAEWNNETAFSYFNKLIIGRNRTNLQLLPFRVSYVVTDNRTLDGIIEANLHIVTDSMTRTGFALILHLMDFLNATHVPIYRSTWGYDIDPKTGLPTDGIVGDVLQGRTDLGGTGTFFSYEAIKFIKFIFVTTFVSSSGTSKFFFRAPSQAFTADLFALPFDGFLWLTCAGFLVVGMAITYIMYKWEYSREYAEVSPEEMRKAKWIDACMTQISALAQMGEYDKISSYSGKMTMFIIFLAFMFIFTAYSARIIVILQSISENIKDIETLYESKMELGLEDCPYNKYFYSEPNARTNEHWRKILYEEKIAPKGKKANIFSVNDGLQLVREKYFAFQVATATASLVIKKFSETEKCSLRMVDTIFAIDDPYLIMPRDSQLEEVMLIGLRRIFEAGLQRREVDKFYPKIEKCQGTESFVVNVGIKETSTAFVIFGIGTLFSCFVLILEKMYFQAQTKRAQRSLKKKDKIVIPK